MDSTHSAVIAALLRQGLAQGQRPLLRVSSDSMVPLLRAGDQVILEAVDPVALRPGDLVTIQTDADLLTHRLWRLQDGGAALITRGDRPLRFDPPWPADRLVGRVIARRRGERELSFTGGNGRRLHRRLARLALWESALVENGRFPRPLLRLLHRLLYRYARLLARAQKPGS